MDADSKSELRKFVDAWQVASAKLEGLRRRDLHDVGIARHIEALNGAFEASITHSVRTSSGLVEQQAVFARMKDAGPFPPSE